VFLHGVGLHYILRRYNTGAEKLRAGNLKVVGVSALFGWAICQTLALHLMEIGLVAISLVGLNLIAEPRDAFYFCANAYTTTGWGKELLARPWNNNNIVPIISIAGLFVFAWTTGSLVSVVRTNESFVAQLLAEREKPRRAA
jgi:hypothetical protein